MTARKTKPAQHTLAELEKIKLDAVQEIAGRLDSIFLGVGPEDLLIREVDPDDNISYEVAMLGQNAQDLADAAQAWQNADCDLSLGRVKT